MALKEEFSRMQEKIVTGAGIVPTVPSDLSNDPKDTWLSTDIMMGEICINPDDDKVFTRTDAGIIELTTSVSALQDLQSVLDEGSTATIAGNINLVAPNLDFTGDVQITGALQLGTSNFIGSLNGSAQLELDFGGTADYIKLASGTAGLRVLGAADAVILETTDGFISFDAGQGYLNHSGQLLIESPAIQFNDDDIRIADNSASAVTTTNIAKNAVIIGSQNSTIDAGVTNSSINGGIDHIIENSYSNISGGYGNDILDTAQRSTINGGSQNTISGVGSENNINAGVSNIINDSTKSIISGGDFHNIDASGDCAIIGGSTNDITSKNYTVILGGTGITAALNNAVYVPDLVIKKSHAIPANSADAVGDVGSVTWDANYLYVKTAAGAWKRTALAAF